MRNVTTSVNCNWGPLCEGVFNVESIQVNAKQMFALNVRFGVLDEFIQGLLMQVGLEIKNTKQHDR